MDVKNGARMEAIDTIMERIENVKSRIAELESNVKQDLPLPSETDGGGGLAREDTSLEDDVVKTLAEIEVLNGSVPEGYPDDENVQYFLAVAELQRTNKVLREQRELSEKNLTSLEEEIASTKEMSACLEDINAELEAQKKRREDEAKKKPSQGVEAAQKRKTQEEEYCQLGNKIRSTIKLYKEFKVFLRELLKKVDSTEDAKMASFLQEIWWQFEKDKTAFVNLPGLSFDVEMPDVFLLQKNGIVEVNPENPQEYRMVDFTG